MKTRHKHADLIHAWAEGAEIEYRTAGLYGEWQTLKGCSVVSWSEGCDYRIKPEKKPDVVRYCISKMFDGKPGFYGLDPQNRDPENNLRLTFDGETGKLIKAEVL